MLRLCFLCVSVVLLTVQADKPAEKENKSYKCLTTDFCKNNPKASRASLEGDIYCCKAGDSIFVHSYSYYHSEDTSTFPATTSSEAINTNGTDANTTEDVSAVSPTKSTSYSNMTCVCNPMTEATAREAQISMAKHFREIANEFNKISQKIEKSMQQYDKAMGVIAGFPKIFGDE